MLRRAGHFVCAPLRLSCTKCVPIPKCLQQLPPSDFMPSHCQLPLIMTDASKKQAKEKLSCQFCHEQPKEPLSKHLQACTCSPATVKVRLVPGGDLVPLTILWQDHLYKCCFADDPQQPQLLCGQLLSTGMTFHKHVQR